MTHDTFAEQIKRLQEVYGERAFPGERQKILWATFKGLSDAEFVDAVSFLLMTYKSTPLLKEFHTAAKEVEEARKGLQRQYADAQSAYKILGRAYKHAEFSNLETKKRVAGRLNLVKEFSIGKITKRHFLEGCNFYETAAGLNSDKIIRSMANDGKEHLSWVSS